ncbi:LamG-like jellyroll fold domain-containing protein, partial [Thomasclavelia sp.]
MKKYGKIILSLAMILSIFTSMSTMIQGQDVDLNDKLKGYYNFEDVNGNIVTNLAGQEYQGTLVGNNVSIKDSKFGKSLYFSDGEEGHMRISNAINANAGDFSISLWYKYDTAFDRGIKKTVLLQQSGSGRTLLSLKADNKYSSYVNGVDVDSNGSVDIDKWQHVTYVYTPATKKITYYINGQFDSQKDAGNNIVNSLTDLLIGRHKNGGNDPLSMRGFVDEIRYYEKAINAQEAKAIYDDKAGIILFDELVDVIEQAEILYGSNKLESSSSEAIKLLENIELAKKIDDKSSLEKIDSTIELLKDAMNEYSLAIRINLNINVNDIERSIDESTFGINHRYAFNGYGSFDSSNMKMKDDFVELYNECKFGSIRYPGGTISNLFQWKGSIGPLENRTKQIHGFYNNTNQHGILPTFGINELGTFAQDVNSEIVYVYGLGRGSAQDAADLIEYLNAPVGLNPNGGVDWAQVRAQNGHVEPFNVRYFEIGNENNQGGTDGTTSQQYWTQFVDTGAEEAYIEGGLVKINRQYAVLKDDWNKAVSDSDGTPNQKRYMRYANPNPMSGDGTVLDNNFKAVVENSVQVFVNGIEWNKVESLDNADNSDKVYTVDYRDGSFTFGDGVHGMIPPKNQEIRVSYQVQRDGFVDISKAMKETMKIIDSSKECNIYSSFETQGFVTKMNNRGYNDYYDGLTIHPYSGTPNGGSSDPEVFYDSAMKKAEEVGIKHVQNYVDMLPEGKVPVISEYGIFRSTDSLVRSQTHALYIAKVMMEYVRLGSPYIQKHCLVDWYSSGADSLGPTQQAVIQAVPQAGANTTTGEGDYKFFVTPSAKVFEMINKNFGNQILSAEFDQVDKMANGVTSYSTLVSKDDEGNIYVAVVNVDRLNSKKMKINLDDFDATNKRIEVQTLVGDSFTAENTLENPNNVSIEKNEFINEKSSVDIELNPHSFTIIKIEAQKEVTLSDIMISKQPDKLEYKINEELDLKGLEVKAIYNDGSEAIISDYQITGYDKNKVGKQTITISYQGKETTFTIIVSEATISTNKAALSIAIDMAEAVTQEQLDKVVPVVANEFKAALQNAQDVYDNASASQKEVDNAFDRLSKVMQMLEFYKGDKAALQKMMNQIANLTANDYTDSTWNALQAVLPGVNEVLGNINAMQGEVDEVYTELVKAFVNLRLKPNKDLLQDLINKANGLNRANYTVASLKL